MIPYEHTRRRKGSMQYYACKQNKRKYDWKSCMRMLYYDTIGRWNWA